MGVRPENTLCAFEHAAVLGAEWIELDVHLTKDGVPMVLHDASLERTTNGRGNVRAQRAAALAKLDAGSFFGTAFANERVPRLDETLGWAKQRGIKVEIEMKGEPHVPDDLPAAVLATVARTGMSKDVLLISFDHHAVKRSKELEPSVRTGVLYVARPVDELSLAKKAKADVLIPHASFVTAESVAAAHGAGLGMATWAASDPALLRALVGTDVDAITVDHPDVLRKILAVGTRKARTRPKGVDR